MAAFHTKVDYDFSQYDYDMQLHGSNCLFTAKPKTELDFSEVVKNTTRLAYEICLKGFDQDSLCVKKLNVFARTLQDYTHRSEIADEKICQGGIDDVVQKISDVVKGQKFLLKGLCCSGHDYVAKFPYPPEAPPLVRQGLRQTILEMLSWCPNDRAEIVSLRSALFQKITGFVASGKKENIPHLEQILPIAFTLDPKGIFLHLHLRDILLSKGSGALLPFFIHQVKLFLNQCTISPLSEPIQAIKALLQRFEPGLKQQRLQGSSQLLERAFKRYERAVISTMHLVKEESRDCKGADRLTSIYNKLSDPSLLESFEEEPISQKERFLTARFMAVDMPREVESGATYFSRKESGLERAIQVTGDFAYLSSIPYLSKFLTEGTRKKVINAIEVPLKGQDQPSLCVRAYTVKDMLRNGMIRPCVLEEGLREIELLEIAAEEDAAGVVGLLSHTQFSKGRLSLMLEAYNYSCATIFQNPKSVASLNKLEILLGLAHGLNFLHKQRCAHLDVKKENMLFKIDENTGSYVGALCDFGFSQEYIAGMGPVYDVYSGYYKEGYYGSIMQTDVQMFGKEKYTGSALAADIFALGGSFYEMVDGTFPKWYYPILGSYKKNFDEDTHSHFDEDTHSHKDLNLLERSQRKALLCVKEEVEDSVRYQEIVKKRGGDVLLTPDEMCAYMIYKMCRLQTADRYTAEDIVDELTSYIPDAYEAYPPE